MFKREEQRLNMSSIKERIREKIKAKQAEQTAAAPDPLFDNPVFTEMKKSMPEEDQKRYEDIGKHMYNNLENDFGEQGEMNAAVETIAQLRVMLQSGMHPCYLTREEKDFLANYVGKEWYKEFGYLESDLNRINF